MRRRRHRSWARALVVAIAACLLVGPAPALARDPLPAQPTPTPSLGIGPQVRLPGPPSVGATGGDPRGPVGRPGGGSGRPPVVGSSATSTSADACDAAPDRLLVRFAPSATGSARSAIVSKVGATRLRAFGLVAGLELVRTGTGRERAAIALRGQRGVESVELDCKVHLDLTPNDSQFGLDWGLRNTGQTGGTPGADIDAAAAWDVRTDASAVRVAVIDTGIQLNHPDLSLNLWTNPGEIAGNGLDDDHNGFVDDVHGWDFVNGDADPSDDNGHGTHVSGTIGARGNNGVGVAGVAWQVKLMPLKAFDSQGSGYTSAIIAALDYAVANGARVSNNSYSGNVFERAEYDAFAAASAAGHLAIVAAGNDGVNNDEVPHYPAAFRLAGEISVAATTQTDALAGFSDFGTLTVQVAAPGEGIYSTWPGSTYATLSGTSMATPHVVGVAALLAAEHLAWTGSQIRDRILGTTRPVAGLVGKVWTGGVVDAGAALSNAATVLPPDPPAPTPQTLSPTIDANPAPPPFAAPPPPAFTEPDVLETSPVDIGPPRIVLDGSGRPTIAYAKTFGGVHLLTLDNGTWADRPLTSAYDDFVWLDLARDGNGVPAVAVQRAWSDLTGFSDPGIVMVTADDPTPAETRISAACPDADTCFWDWNPAVAYDAAGAAHVAFTRTAPLDDDMVQAPAGSVTPVEGTGLYYATNATGPWIVRRVTTGPRDGPAAIAVEPDGTVHIVLSETNGSLSGLYHVTNAGGTWTSLQLTDHVQDQGASVGVDADGAVHVAFTRPAFGVFHLRRAPGGAWDAAEQVFDGNAVSPDLAIDADGHVHIAFGLVDETSTVDGVRYITNRSGSWVTSTVADHASAYPDLTVDAAGHAHITYERWADAPLGIYYATNATGSFVSSLVQANSLEDQQTGTTAYAVDASGHHHVAIASHYGEASAGLWYGNDVTGSWLFSRVYAGWPTDVAMVLDSAGHAHIAFNQQLDAAHNTFLPGNQWRVGYATNAGGTWTVETVRSGPFSWGVAIVLDSSSRPVVVFGDEQTTHLLRARRIGTSWTIDTILSGYGNIRQPAALLDASGVLHVAIAAEAPGDLGLRIVYVHGTTGSWQASSATNGSLFRFSPTIARSADGAIWIASEVPGESVSVHHLPLGGSWATTVIDASAGDLDPSLAIGRDGKVHVVYTRYIGYGGSGCTIPECAAGPGLRHAVLTGTTWATTKLSPQWRDAMSILSAGADGSLSLAFHRVYGGLRSLELLTGQPAATIRLQAASDTGVSAADRLTRAATLVYDVTFDRPVSGLAAADFSRTGSATGCIVNAPAGAGAAYTVSVGGCSGGTVGLALKAGSVVDGAALSGPAAAISAGTVVIDRTAPTTASVAAAPRVGAVATGSVVPVRLTWAGSDGGGSGVGSYDVARSLNGSATWTTVSASLGSARVDLDAAASGTVRYRVRTTDRAGNSGAWTYGPTLTPRLRQESFASIHYHGTWHTSTSASFSGGGARYATAAGASATYTFTGRAVALVTTRALSRGSVKVYVNGVYVGTVNLATTTTSYRTVAWMKTWSTVATRTVMFVVVGTAGHPRVDLDGIAILG